MAEKNIYRLSPHEEAKVAQNLWVRRVPGGWIYIDGGYDTTVAVFVPANDEFRDWYDCLAQSGPEGGDNGQGSPEKVQSDL